MHMAVNKVELNGETLMDLTNDTVSPSRLLSGYSAHDRAGELIEGLVVVPTKVSELENDKNYLTETGDASEVTVTFEQAAERANIKPGDNLSIAFAKLSKFCEDLKPHAFAAPTTNLLATEPGISLDQTMGKVLNDKIAELSGNLSDFIRVINVSSSQVNIPGTSAVSVDANINVPAGYKLIEVFPRTTNNQVWLSCDCFKTSATTCRFSISNHLSQELPGMAYGYAIIVKK